MTKKKKKKKKRSAFVRQIDGRFINNENNHYSRASLAVDGFTVSVNPAAVSISNIAFPFSRVGTLPGSEVRVPTSAHRHGSVS